MKIVTTQHPLTRVAEADQRQIQSLLDQILQAADQDPIIQDQLHVNLIPVLRHMHRRGHVIRDWDAKRWGLL